MKKRVLAILLTIAVLCASLPVALSTAAAEAVVTDISEGSNTDKIISPDDNVLKSAVNIAYTKAGEVTVPEAMHDGALCLAQASTTLWAPSNRDTYNVWVQYDFGTEYAIDSLLLASGGYAKQTDVGCLYGFDIYVGSTNAAALMADATVATPVYSTTDTISYGRRIDLPTAAVGQYVVFRLGGFKKTWNVGQCWVSELAATGEEANADVVTEIDNGVNEDMIIAPADNVLTKASGTRYTMGDGWGWGDSATNVVTSPISSCVYDGVLFGDVFELGNTYAGHVWIEYAFATEYEFDSFLIAGLNADKFGDGVDVGVNGVDVYVGNTPYEELQNDSAISLVYSTKDNITKGRHVQFGKKVTGKYILFRFDGFNQSWCDCCWISELAATGHAAHPDVVTDITADANTDKVPLTHQNVLPKATNIAYTKAGEVSVPDTMLDGQMNLSAGAAANWAPSNKDTYNVWVQYDFGEDYAINSLLLAGGGDPSWDNGGLGIYGFDVYVGSATAADLMADATVATPVYSTADTICYARRVDLGKAATGRYVVFRLGGFTKTWNVGQCWISEMAAIGRAVDASSNISAMANVYVPDTGIVNPPVVVQKVTDFLPSMDKALPAVAVMDIDDQLNVLNGEGVAFTTVGEFCQQYSEYVIGAYVVDSAAEVTALTVYLTQNGVVDAYVFAAEEDMALATAAWQAMPSLRCGIICETVGADEADWAALCAKVHNDTGVTQILSKTALSMDAVTYFNNHIVAAWSMAADTAGVYRAVSAGYHAVVAADPALVYGVYESITQVTVSGRPLPISHRGATMAHGQKEDAKGENTIDGFLQAHEYGYLGVEADLRITKTCNPATCDHGCADHAACADCQPNIVLHHDWNLDRTTDAETLFGANLTTKDLTMAQLRTLTVDYLVGLQGWTGTMCTFEEALAATEERGLVYYCHINDLEVLPLFNAVLAAHPEYVDNCIVFVTPSAVLDGTFDYKAVTAPVPFLFADSDAMAEMMGQTDAQAVLKDMRLLMNPYNANPIFYTITYANFNSNDNFYYQSAARGFQTFHTITNDDVELNKALLTKNGAVGLLTDTIWCTADWHYAVDIKADTVTLAPGKALNTVHDVLCIDEVIDKASCGFVQLSGPELTYSEEAGGYVAAADATGDAVVVFYYDSTAPGDTAAGDATYRIYSQPVTVSVNSNTVESPVAFVGGQIRSTDAVTGVTALRFGFDLPCTGVSYADPGVDYVRRLDDAEVVINGKEYELVDFGAIVSLRDDVELTLESSSVEVNVKAVPALRLYDVKGDVVRYTAVVTNVPTDHKDTPIYACPYVTYKDGEDTITVYGDVCSRSVNQVLGTAG